MTHTSDTKEVDTPKTKSKQRPAPEARVEQLLTEQAQLRDKLLLTERERDELRLERDRYRSHLVALANIERRRQISTARRVAKREPSGVSSE